MQVRILGWSYKGIRGVNNLNISISASSSQPYRTSMIMMPNGTGKTTTITLLRAIFDGTASGWGTAKVREFRPPGGIAEGSFTTNLVIDDMPYQVTIKMDYIRGFAVYMTTRTGSQGGLNEGHDLPTYVKDVFTDEFVKRFVFDGELANSILSSGKGEAEEAIRFLYHINRLNDIKGTIDRIIETEQRKSERSKIKKEQGLNSLRTQIYSKRTQRNSLLARIEKLKIDNKELQNRLKALDSKLLSAKKKDTTLEKIIKDLEKKQITNTLELKEKTNKLLDELRNPNLISKQIADRLTSLSDKMQYLKLPRTMSRQFFEELAEQHSCVCGRPITMNERSVILDRSMEYLAEDQIGVINSIKSSVKDRHYSTSVSPIKDEVQNLLNMKYENDAEYERLLQQRREEADEEDQKLMDEQEHLRQSYNENVSELDLITTKDRMKLMMVSADNNLYLVEESLEDLEKKYNEATRTVQLSKNAEKIKEYISFVESEALSNMKEMIRKETNDKLNHIIKSESIYVEKIDGHLILRGKTGTSVGQSLAIAYSYLGSLFHASSHELPFIVDSPAGALDLGVRREISKILPSLFKQLIIFITSGEREGFAEYFYTLDEVQFLTVHRTPSSYVYCEEGIDYFKSFQEAEVIKRGDAQ